MSEMVDTIPTVLVVEKEVLVRVSIAQYLRHCGYCVMEASGASEALDALTATDIRIDIVFSEIAMSGDMDGFGLAQWIRKNRPAIQIVLAGTMEKAAKEAGELCEKGPHLKKPYEPQQVLDYIKQLLATKLKK